MANKFDNIIIGGGAAGLFALRGLKDEKTAIIESNTKLGAKLLITGGGKCNFTNKTVKAHNYISANPHFIKSHISKFTPHDFLQIIRNHKIKYEERDNGKLFTLSGAEKILESLLSDGKSNNHTFFTDTRVTKVSKDDYGFKISTDKGNFEADKVIVASGGLSYPKLGATGIAYKIAENFGMTVEKTAPALTSLPYPENIVTDFSQLSGISVNAVFTIKKKSIRDELLFTHRGFSGPLALNASLYMKDCNEITADFAPDLDIETLINENRQSKKSLVGLLSFHMTKALVKALIGEMDYNISKIRKSEIENIYNAIKNRKFIITGKDGYNKAEVTLGGVSVNDIVPTTMESRKCKGLYFIGEALDITGELGGYNLHWAWASAQTFILGKLINK